MTTIIQVRVFGGPLDGADVSVNVDPYGWPPAVAWVNRTRLPQDLVVWPGVLPDPPEELAGPLWSKYVVAPDDHNGVRSPWRYNFVRGQDQEPLFPLDWLDNS